MPYSGNPTVARFKTDMVKFRNQMAVSLEENLLQQASELADNMRGAAPVVTGALRASIRVRNVSQKYGNRTRVSILVLAGGPLTTRGYSRSATYQREVRIGSGDTAGIARMAGGHGVSYDYSLAIEFGSMRNDPEPFFYSSARLYGQQGREMARETVERAVEENNKVRALRSENYSNAGFTHSVGGRGGATVIRGRQLL